MSIKLHRCSAMWLKVGVHPCWTEVVARIRDGRVVPERAGAA